MGLALTGTILLSSKKVKFRKVRLTAFILWVFSNAYWSFVSLDPALRLQFFIYFCLALWGVWNNWRDTDVK